MWKRVCRADEVPVDGLKHIELAGAPPVVVANARDEFFACQAYCPHQRVSLANGVHDGTVLTCLEHMWQFDLRTGAARGCAEAPMTSYQIKRENDDLYVWFPPS